MAIGKNFILKGAAYFALSILAIFSFADGASARSWEKDLIKAKSALEEKRCDDAWNLMWYWARQGHTDANAALSAALLLYGIYPPNLPDHEKNWKTTWLYFIMNAYDTRFPFEPDMVIELLNSPTVHQPYGRHIAKCVGTRPNVQCRNLAVKLHLIPSREDFVKTVENKAGKPVQCWPQTNILQKSPR